ncbi:PAS domain-containing protein [Phenylobacterium sp.]|uniref:PAS domain-containing protein n=1 Tax=Phenylobacterium sp. TaxID=1871053 RepID=UPI0035B48152
MFHLSTHKLIDYWRAHSLDGRSPSRQDIDPGDFAPLAPQVLMAGREASGVYPIRLVGGFVRELHQRDLRGRNLLSLFRPADRLGLQAALEMARRKPEPIVATVEARAEDAAIDMEILFAPLTGSDGGPDRFLGLYQPLTLVSRLQDRPVGEFEVRVIRSAGASNESLPRVRLAALDGRRIA